MAFHVTSAAAREILAAAERSDATGMALRVAAKGTDDGVAYGMGFDDPAPQDAIAEFDGLTVLIAAQSRPWLEFTMLDFVEVEPGRHDFVFVPAAETGAGGCATRPSTAGSCGGGGCSGCG